MITILIIDDDPVILRLVKIMLGLDEYDVRTATSVAEAFDVMETTIPDVICCDLMMPDVNGLDFLEQRREMPTIASIPVVVVSGIGKQSWFDRARDLGAAAYIAKPFNAAQLTEAIDKAMATKVAA